MSCRSRMKLYFSNPVSNPSKTSSAAQSAPPASRRAEAAAHADRSVALFFRERGAFVVAGMVEEGKTKQFGPDHRFRHGSCLMFSLSGDASPGTVNRKNAPIHGSTGPADSGLTPNSSIPRCSGDIPSSTPAHIAPSSVTDSLPRRAASRYRSTLITFFTCSPTRCQHALLRGVFLECLQLALSSARQAPASATRAPSPPASSAPAGPAHSQKAC